MKTLQRHSTMICLAISVAGTLTFSNAFAVESRTPICSLPKDVTAVQGRGAPVPSSVYCAVERKVSQPAGTTHVSEVQGRAGAAPNVKTEVMKAVQASAAQARFVETVLGRAGGAPRSQVPADNTVAAPTIK